MKRLVPLLIFGMLMAACSRSTAGPHPPSQPDAPVTAPAVAQQPYKPGEKHQQALRLIDNQKFPAAETVLKQVVAEEPNAAEAWNDLSFVQAQLGRFHDSAASAKQALALKPGFSFAEYNLGWALLQTSDGWKDAKPHLDASAAAQPDRPEPYYALGLWYKYAGDLSGAQSAFQRGARLNYGPALGAQVKLKDDVAASASVSQVVARFPEAPVQVVWDLMRDYI